MQIELLHHTPLWVADKAIGKCWDKPTPDVDALDDFGECYYEDAIKVTIPGCNTERIDRVANKNKHASTIEHLNYTFDIDGISRACLQELARHRMASLSVKSTRYTLKELKEEKEFATYTLKSENPHDTYNVVEDGYKRASKYVVLLNNTDIDESIVFNLEELRTVVSNGMSNDIAKYCIPEAYKTSLIWTINARSLQNFLELRTNKVALWEIRELAYEVFKQLPEDHKFLFEDCIYRENKGDKNV